MDFKNLNLTVLQEIALESVVETLGNLECPPTADRYVAQRLAMQAEAKIGSMDLQGFSPYARELLVQSIATLIAIQWYHGMKSE